MITYQMITLEIFSHPMSYVLCMECIEKNFQQFTIYPLEERMIIGSSLPIDSNSVSL